MFKIWLFQDVRISGVEVTGCTQGFGIVYSRTVIVSLMREGCFLLKTGGKYGLLISLHCCVNDPHMSNEIDLNILVCTSLRTCLIVVLPQL